MAVTWVEGNKPREAVMTGSTMEGLHGQPGDGALVMGMESR